MRKYWIIIVIDKFPIIKVTIITTDRNKSGVPLSGPHNLNIKNAGITGIIKFKKSQSAGLFPFDNREINYINIP